jgi:hypothetical protein
MMTVIDTATTDKIESPVMLGFGLVLSVGLCRGRGQA